LDKYKQVIIVVILMILSGCVIIITKQIYVKELLDLIILIAFIYIIIANIVISTITNYVRGIREQYYEQIRRIKNLAWECHSYFYNSLDQNIQDILSKYIEPLLSNDMEEWNLEYVKDFRKGDIREHLAPLIIRKKQNEQIYQFVYKYISQIEDELNELSYLCIRRIAAPELNKRNARNIFCFIVSVIVVYIIGKCIPKTFVNNEIGLILSIVSIGIITWAITEVWNLGSLFVKEMMEEAFPNKPQRH